MRFLIYLMPPSSKYSVLTPRPDKCRKSERQNYIFWWFFIWIDTKIFDMTRTSSLYGGTSPLHKKQAVTCRNMNWIKSKYLFCTTFELIWTRVRTSPNGHERDIHRVRTPLRGGHWDFRFYGFGNFLDQFFGFIPSLIFRFWRLLQFAVYSILLSLSGFQQKSMPSSSKNFVLSPRTDKCRKSKRQNCATSFLFL